MRISDWSSDVCSSDLMIDVQIRAKLAGAHVGKSEADSNRRHRRGSRCRYIDRRISNIDCLGPFGLRNCGEQRVWIGLANRQCVPPDQRLEHTRPAERFDPKSCTSPLLVCETTQPEETDAPDRQSEVCGKRRP